MFLEEAFTFYKSVFGGDLTKILHFKDLASDEFQVPESEASKIMTIASPIGKHNVLIANDVPEFIGRINENENRSKISVSVGSREEAEKSLTGYLRAEALKGRTTIVRGVFMPACSEVNMALNGW